VPAEHEVYFAITDSTEFRAPTMTLTHMGGIDIEELDKHQLAQVPFEALTGLKAFVVANALSDIGAPKEIMLLVVLWKDYRSGALTEKDLETAAFNVFLYGRMIGAAAEIHDHLNRGRNMDTRTPLEQGALVV
jgi:succinyl-CoA synthetase beta subunit